MSLASSVARARWSALLTDATLVRAAPRPRSPSSAAPRTGSAPRAGAAEDAAARPRRPAGSSRAPRDVGRIAVRATSPSGTGSIQVNSGSVSPDRLGARAPGRGPSGARGARVPSACRGRRSSRSGRARSATPRGPRSGRGSSTHAGAFLDGVLGLEGRAEHPVAVRGSSRRCCSSSANAGVTVSDDPPDGHLMGPRPGCDGRAVDGFEPTDEFSAVAASLVQMAQLQGDQR